jgi:hypothetical protein
MLEQDKVIPVKINLSIEFGRSFNRLMFYEYLHVVRGEYFHISVVIR